MSDIELTPGGGPDGPDDGRRKPERRHIRCPYLRDESDDETLITTKVYITVSYEGKILDIDCEHYTKMLGKCEHPKNERWDKACIAFSG